MKFRLFFTIIIFSVFFSVLNAEEEQFLPLHQYAQRSWRAVSGLAHDNVASIYRDKQGFIWAGTIEGLSRIDGSSSRIFTARTYPQMQSNRIVAVEGFSDNTLYVATAMGISKLYENRFQKVIEETGILSMTVTENGLIYASKGSEILSIYNGEVKRLSIVNGLPEGTVNSIDSFKDILYIGTSSGFIVSYSNGTFSKNLCELNTLPVTAIFAQSEKIVFGNSAGKLFSVNGGECISMTPGELDQNASGPVKSISGNGDSIRAITDNYLIFNDNGKSRYVKNCCNIPGVPSAIILDNEMNLWIAGNKGLSLFYAGTFATIGKDEGLFSEMVYAMIEDNDGRVWVGSRGGGLFYYSEGLFRQVPEKSGIKSSFIGGLMLDDLGNIWAGTSKGIITFSPGPQIKVKDIPTNRKGATPLASVIFQDSRKRIWVGTAGGAVYLYVNGSFSFIRQVGVDGEDYISAITEDNKGKLWFATSSGLLVFDKDSFKTISVKEGLPDNLVLSVFADGTGTIFAGMMRTGLSLIMPDGKIISVNTKNGLCSDTIYSIIQDSNDNLWFTSTQGIFSLKKQQIIDVATGKTEALECYQFDTQDGIKRPENTGGVQPASMMRKNGELWFPTVEGIAAVRLSKRSESTPHVTIDDILVDGKNIKITNGLKVSGAVSLVEIKYTASRFVHPERLKIRHRLDPLEKNWTQLAERTTASYQKLPSGNYSFLIEAEDEKGNIQKLSISFIVENTSLFNDIPTSLVLAFFLLLIASAGVLLLIFSKKKRKSVLILSVPEKEELPVQEPVSSNQIENFIEDEFIEFGEEVKDDSPKYEKSRLDDEVATAYATELKDLMEKEKLYKNPELTLPELAKRLNLSTNILSQVINGHCKLNFYTFVNIYRTEAVIEMMKDDFYKDRSILDIAYDAGFKSKTTFNTIFKKHTGITPSEFRKNVLEN
ncbi:MAG TPA: two-component regulator propeller domain-containing protein, partial [bacterium]|nr:two-component regulator propeller domain-containing protein [bacterium]